MRQNASLIHSYRGIIQNRSPHNYVINLLNFLWKKETIRTPISTSQYVSLGQNNFRNGSFECNGFRCYLSSNSCRMPMDTKFRSIYQENSAAQKDHRFDFLLESTVGTWTIKELSLVRSILERCLLRTRNQKQTFETLLTNTSRATKLQFRCLKECLAGNKAIIEKLSIVDENMLIRYLHRILYSWRLCLDESATSKRSTLTKSQGLRHIQARRSFENSRNEVRLSEPTASSVELIEKFLETNKSMMSNADDREVLFISEKSCSMMFLILKNEAKYYPDTIPICLEKADQIMQQLLDQWKNPVDVIVWNSYLSFLAESCKRLTDCPEKLEKIVLQKGLSITSKPRISDSLQPDEKTYSTVLQGWTNSPRSDAALRSLEFLNKVRSDFSVDTVCYNICIRALGRAHHGQYAEDLLWRMHEEYTSKKSTNVRPDHYSFLAAIDGWSKCKQPARAKILLEKMIMLQETNPHYTGWLYPTTEVYTAVMDAYASHQENPGPQVEALLRQLEKSYFVESNDKEDDFDDSVTKNSMCKPSMITYSTAIRAWAKTTNHDEAPERAEAIVRQMEEYAKADGSFAPNAIVYTTLIQAWANNKMRDDGPQCALSILRRMTARHVSPTTVTYNTVLGAFANRGKANEAHKLLLEMIEESRKGSNSIVQPDPNSWATVLQAYARSGLPEAGNEALSILRDMERYLDQIVAENSNRYPRVLSSTAYVAVIRALGRSGHYEKAETVLWDMVKRYEINIERKLVTAKPDVLVCNAVLKTWWYSDEPVAPDRADAIWNWLMQQDKPPDHYIAIRPDAMTAKHIISIWEKSKRESAGRKIHEIIEDLRNRYPGVLDTKWLQSSIPPYLSSIA